MEFGTTIPLFFLSLCCCATFPIIIGTLIFSMSRDESRRPLAIAILLSGITFGTIATLPQLFSVLGYSGGNILSLVMGGSVYFYLAFGIGSLTATMIGVPGSYVVSRISSWRNSDKVVNTMGPEDDETRK